MKCSDFWSCIEALIADNKLISAFYQTGLIYLLPLLIAIIGVVTLIWLRSLPEKSRTQHSTFSAGAALLVSFLLALPAAIFKASPASFMRLLGIPPDISVFHLSYETFVLAADAAKWAAWASLLGMGMAVATAWLPLRYQLASQKQLRRRSRTGAPQSPWSPSTPSPPKGPFVEVNPGELTPIPGVEEPSVHASSNRGVSGGGRFDPEQTIAPPESSKPYQPPDRRVAWLELQWVDGSPYKGRPSRWRIDQLQYPPIIGRISEKRYDHQIPLPDAPQNVSRKQVEIRARKDGYYLVNLGKARVKVDKETVPQDPMREVPLESGMTITIGRYDFVFYEMAYPTVIISSPDLKRPKHWLAPDRFTIGGSDDDIDVKAENTVARVYFDIEKGGFFIEKIGGESVMLTLDEDEKPLKDEPMPLHDGSILRYFSYDIQFTFPTF